MSSSETRTVPATAGRVASAAAWAAAVNAVWHSRDGQDVLAQARATGSVAGVDICRERVESSEDNRTVLVSADFAWTILLDAVRGDWRAL